MKVFKGMDVGTAKIGKQEQREVPHHLLDVVDVTETFTAGDFRDKAYEIIEVSRTLMYMYPCVACGGS